MTDSKALIERLRADWPEILVEKHWMMDSDAIEEQRREAADAIEELDRHLTLSGKVNKALSERIEKLEADKARLREALTTLVEEYVTNVDCTRLGGFYLDPESEECVVEARAALQETSHDA